ncbi:hypothetical protein [Streptomyces sp. NPDC008122]|uniref:hypothetical protein n=1 Tax=Streptomyces sp. NPDC008122 TaxID=3364810 RepID=UPI0036E65D60
MGAVTPQAVREEAARLGPVIDSLAAALALARPCDDEGPFRACGSWTARRSRRRPRRLLGVNTGPDLTYTGSLAALPWRRIVHGHEHPFAVGEFTRLDLLTVPAALTASTVTPWASLQMCGG